MSKIKTENRKIEPANKSESNPYVLVRIALDWVRSLSPTFAIENLDCVDAIVPPSHWRD